MEQEQAAEHTAGTPPKKSRLGLILATVVIVVLVAGAAVAGTMLGPKLMGQEKKKESAEHSEDSEGSEHSEKSSKGGKDEKPIGETSELPPILVDTRGADGALHHLKVVLAVELTEGTPKEEFMKYAPRGREAAVAYLRTQTYDTIAAPERYEEVRAELGKTFAQAVGEKRVSRILITDFVAQ
jgi:flagellar basal body-associated protein FliL